MARPNGSMSGIRAGEKLKSIPVSWLRALAALEPFRISIEYGTRPRGKRLHAPTPKGSDELADRNPASQGPQGAGGPFRHRGAFRPASRILAREKPERRGPGPFAA